MHRHRAKKTREQAFTACQRPDRCNPAAHGNLTVEDTCQCGAVRRTNVNQRAAEIGPWRADEEN